MWAPPRIIGEYRLTEQIGRGAMGEVWRAMDGALDREVAIKIILRSGLDPVQARRRFLVEARAMARLRHPSLLQVLHAGEVEGHPYLVTDLLEGTSIDKLELPLDPGEVVRIGAALAGGLAVAHDAGVLHRDLKPGNAFLCEDGSVKILDFGLAKLTDLADGAMAPARRSRGSVGEDAHNGATRSTLDDETALLVRARPAAVAPGEENGGAVALSSWADADTSATGSGLYGTPLYMAPELWVCWPATRSSDVYALGAVLYRLLSGRGVHVGRTVAEIRDAALEEEPTSLAELAPATPRELITTVHRCLDGQACARPSADAVREALEALATPGPATSPGVGLRDPGDGGDPGGNPYLGLRAFDDAHRALFFGRDREVRKVLADLRAAPLVLLCGRSGAGKSSLAHAGVGPEVQCGALGDGAREVVTLVPGRRPLLALATALGLFLGEGSDARALGGNAYADPDCLARAVRASGRRLLIIVDQLEEVITLAEAGARPAFCAALGALIDSGASVRAVATLRSDFLGQLAALGDLHAALLRAIVPVGPMSRAGLERAVVEPVRRRGFAFESEAMVESLVGFGEEGTLPLLQFALAGLWEARDKERRLLPERALVDMGGAEGALAHYADSVLDRLAVAERDQSRHILLDLAAADGTRVRREAAALFARRTGDDSMGRERALAALVEGRLVTACEGEAGAAYELAHEALQSSWPRLAGWLDQERTVREAVARVERATSEWQRLDRGAEALYRGRALAELDLIDDPSLTDDERDFVRASRAAAVRQRRVRVGLAVGVPSLALAVLVGTLAMASWRAHRAAEAFVSARVAEAETLLAEADRLERAHEAARAEAFARFDARDRRAAEQRWAEALALEKQLADTLGDASAILGRGLAHLPAHPVARARAADVALRSYLVAERHPEKAALTADLLRRLRAVDHDGSRRALLAATARLAITSQPSDATLLLRHIYPDRDGYRVEDAGRALAAGTPVDLAPGSYVVELTRPGRMPARYPVLLRRGETVREEVFLPRAKSVPDGFVYVPAGASLVGAADVEPKRMELEAHPEHRVRVEGFLMAEHETTFGEYLAFLAALPAKERQARRVCAACMHDPVLAPGERMCREGRAADDPRRCQDWSQLPVVSIAWEDAVAYARWLSKTGRVPGARLCTEREWERAARGAGDRLYPQGDVLHRQDANHEATHGDDHRSRGADAVGSFAKDVSLFGVRDLAGNVAEWVADNLDGKESSRRVARGGSWGIGSFYGRGSYRAPISFDRSGAIGFRVCALVGLSGGAARDVDE